MSSGMTFDGVATDIFTDLENPRRKPKRVIHFSDGTLEEFSDEEERPEQIKSLAPQKEPKNMAWGEYLLYLTLSSGTKALGFCDYFGEKFAWFFGITSAKYQYAIDEGMVQDQAEGIVIRAMLRISSANAASPVGGHHCLQGFYR
jgi:hypothetical protein